MTTPKVRGLRTPKSALKALKQTIKGREDYVYQRQRVGCLYVHDAETTHPTPGCLIGHLLHAHGVPLEWLSVEADDGLGAAGYVARNLGLPDDVGRLLARAQRRQDNGWSWAQAVKHAADSLSE